MVVVLLCATFIRLSMYSVQSHIILLPYKETRFLSRIEFALWFDFDGCKRECLFGDLHTRRSRSSFLALLCLTLVSTYISPVMGLTAWTVVKASRRITSIPRLPWKSRIATNFTVAERLKTECSHSGPLLLVNSIRKSNSNARWMHHQQKKRVGDLYTERVFFK